MADPFAKARLHMRRKHLAARGIRSDRVLDAMCRVPREQFVDVDDRHRAYDDIALAIDCGQTISQPYIVALTTEALDVDRTSRVLDVGTGSGYQAAVLAELAAWVVTIERHAALSLRAQKLLGELNYQNVEFRVGDGAEGAADKAPFDGISVAAAAATIPSALLEQLADGGRLVAPVGPSGEQILKCITRRGDRFESRDLSTCRFVPLITGWK